MFVNSDGTDYGQRAFGFLVFFDSDLNSNLVSIKHTPETALNPIHPDLKTPKLVTWVKNLRAGNW